MDLKNKAKELARMVGQNIAYQFSELAFNDPAVLDRVHAGFDALSNLPDFYQYLLFISVSASFGIRGADKLMKLRK